MTALPHHRIISRAIVPLCAARYAGQRAICVKLSSGFMAWGYADDFPAAERNAITAARTLELAAAKEMSC